MAIQACSECGKDVSDKAGTCPHCGAPAPQPPKKAVKSAPIWVQVVIGLIGAYASVSCVAGGSDTKSTNTTESLSSSTALFMCQTALKRASHDPENASVPYVTDQGRGDEYYFAWGASTKPARMRNALGNEVAVGASCIVSKSQKRILSLTLNGQTII